MKKTFFHSPRGKWTILIITVLLCAVGTVLFLETEPQKESAGAHGPEADPALSGMPVTITSVSPASYPALITALGEVKPLWQSAIKARVDGPVLHVSDRLQPGNLVKKGELLVEIDRTSFEGRVSETESRAAQSRLDLLKEEREAREAQTNWKRSGLAGKPTSPLVLREPQLKAARAALKAAQGAVANARQQCSYTCIRAPFDGIILERRVNPGETLFAGDEVCTIFGVRTAEISVHVDAAQWDLLGDAKERMNVRLFSPQTSASWPAHLVRDGRCLDPQSRLRTLYLQVDRPLSRTPPLLPGTFVRAEITGRDIPSLLRIPETALTRQGLVWFVDDGNRLRSIQAQPVFYGKGVVYIRSPQNTEGNPRVAVLPNAGFTNGLPVQPKTEPRG